MEIEATLIICSADPREAARKIAALTSIGNYRLQAQDSQTIHDLYFDTPDTALKTRNLSLRIREIGGKKWITLKGRSQRSDWGGVERMEIEEPWSESALTGVATELMDRNIRMPHKIHEFDVGEPVDVMFRLGLEVVQHRETHREVRNVVGGETGNFILAELAIDSVVYHFNDRTTCHHEVEIEAKVKDASPVLRTVIEALIAMFGPTLRRWDYSKLATGKAIETLLSEGTLDRLLDASNNLKPAAYDKIAHLLEQGVA